MKKLTAFFLALVMAVTVLSVPASAKTKEVTIFGVTVPADTKEICFANGDGDSIDTIYAEMDAPGYDTYAFIGDKTVDFAEVAEKLPKLKSLAVVNCGMKNTDSLAKLENLTTLGLYKNDETVKLSVLKKLTGLKKFGYRNMQCEKMPPISSLTNLTELSICVPWKVFTDLSMLRGMTKMKKLTLKYGSFKDLSALKKMTNLRALEVESFYLEDISALKGLKKLKVLSVAQTEKVTCADLAELKNLTALALHSMKFRDIGELAKLPNLKELTVTNPDSRAGSNLYWHVSELTQLETLQLVGVKTFDCKFVKGLTNLKTLVMDVCDIYYLDGMETLTNLTYLSAPYNKLKDISPLAGLTELKVLNLNSNSVKDLTPVKKLKKLEYLGISYSRDADPTPILKLKNLKTLYAPDSAVDAEFAEKYKKINPECEVTYVYRYEQ